MGLTLLQLGLSACVAYDRVVGWTGLQHSRSAVYFHLLAIYLDYIETFTPVVIEGKTKWVNARIDRQFEGDQVTLLAEVNGNPLEETIIAPYTEDRSLIASSGPGEVVSRSTAVEFTSDQSSAQVELTLGEKLKSYETLVWSTPRARIFHGSVTVDIENLLPGTVVRYTTDGSVQHRLNIWDTAISIDATTNFKLLALLRWSTIRHMI